MTTHGYTLDTNIIRPLLRKNQAVVARVKQALREGIPVKFNALTYFETKRGLVAADAKRQLERFDRLCGELGILMLDRDSLDKADDIYSTLRRLGALIEDADLLIAATAITNNLTLVTDNIAHFERVPDLEIENWLPPPEEPQSSKEAQRAGSDQAPPRARDGRSPEKGIGEQARPDSTESGASESGGTS